MEELTRLARPEILAMHPYSSARTEGAQTAEIFLDANENPYPPYPGGAQQEGLNRYPEPQPQHLVARFAELYDVAPASIFLSRGADEAIDLLVRAFCAAGTDAVLQTPPTFVMYETAARIQGAEVVSVPLQAESFQLDVAAMLSAVDRNPGVKLVFLCSPNNPTANLMRREDVLTLAGGLLGRALVVVDQTYVEYSGQRPYAADLPQHPNLVVLRTLSKEYSLAGERFGITVAHPEVIGILRRIMAPYPIPVSSIRAVTEAMSPEGIAYGRANIERLLAQRERLETALADLPAVRRVWPSDANYLLVQVTDAAGLISYLESHGIKIRNRSAVVPGAVRITVGTPAQNDRLLESLSTWAG